MNYTTVIREARLRAEAASRLLSHLEASDPDIDHDEVVGAASGLLHEAEDWIRKAS